MSTPPNKTAKKIYSTPQLKKLDFEQAALFLVGHAYNNADPGAFKLLEEMFPDSLLLPSA